MREDAVQRFHLFGVMGRTSLMVICAAGLTTSALAQGSRESQSVHLRHDCRLAAQILEKGHPAVETDWALSTIRFCDESGGRALQALWATPVVDSAALEQLVAASSSLLDQRVYDAVMTTARDAGRSRATRLAALRVLSAFIDRTTSINPDYLLKPNPDTTLLIQFATVSGGIGQIAGSQPLSASAPSDIRALFATLAKTDSDAVVRRAGRSLQSWFSRH